MIRVQESENLGFMPPLGMLGSQLLRLVVFSHIDLWEFVTSTSNIVCSHCLHKLQLLIQTVLQQQGLMDKSLNHQ